MKVAAVVAGFALLAACAPKPPEPLRNPKPKQRPIPEAEVSPPPPPRVAHVPRPAVTLPPLPPAPRRDDPSDLVRWPLGHNTHPALEPAFAIARVFAQPGVSWIDLCARGVQNRRGGGIAEEHRTYLTAWCEVLKRDAASALARLAPLRNSLQHGLSDAVRRDVANIVVDAGPSDIAEDLLARARIDDLAVYDLVAATYAEVGRTNDARRFNLRALAGSSRASPGHCERSARAILLADPSTRSELIDRLRRGGGCHALADDLACWHDAKLCLLTRTPVQVVHDVYTGWPAAPAQGHVWFQLGDAAHRAFPSPGSDTLATAAFTAALRALPCRDAIVGLVVGEAAELRADPRHDPALDAQLDQIMWTPEQLCQP